SAKAAGRGAMPVVSVEHDAIDAVVLPIEEIRQRLGQRVGHFASLGLELPRQGPLVRGASPRTSVAALKGGERGQLGQVLRLLGVWHRRGSTAGGWLRRADAPRGGVAPGGSSYCSRPTGAVDGAAWCRRPRRAARWR